MAQDGGSYDKFLVNAIVGVGGITFDDVTVKEVILGESLLTPGLQTAVTLQSFVYSPQPKDWGSFKNKQLSLSMSDETGRYMDVRQTLYRIDNRELDINVGQTESLTLHACDPTLLDDGRHLVSQSWKCVRPSEIVEEVLQSCVNARGPVVDSAGPARDYIAENIHPFQVIQQQCNVALYNDNNPDFLHYMTYENSQTGQGTHYFRSLKYLETRNVKATFTNTEGGVGDIADGGKAISFSFPCDFDLLSDILNGVDADGSIINTLSTINPFNQAGSLFGGSMAGGPCGGLGGGNHKTSTTNSGSAQQQNSCEMSVEKYLLLRQARMALLEKDKIAFRITVPWRPDLHVGDLIGFLFREKPYSQGGSLYGTDSYLIVALKHNIQFGGFATSTFDCIRTNIG